MQATLTVEKVIHGGYGLARLADGEVVLVRGALPGEVVEVNLCRQKGVLFGEPTRLHTPHPERVPASPHPGLDFSHASYALQLELKRQIIAEALARALGRELAVPPLHPAPAIWRYRSSIQPVVTPAGLGYRRPESHEVVTLADDPVASPPLSAAWQRLAHLRWPKGVRELVLKGNDEGEVLAALIARASAKNYLDFAHQLLALGLSGVGYARFDPRGRFRSGSERLAGARTIRQRYGAFDITVGLNSFAQPNPTAASAAYRALQALAPGGRHALDLYAGSGIIGMHLAAKYARVTALEIDRSSVTRGQADARRLGIDNLYFIRADAKALAIPDDVELVSVDPPRSGLGRELRAALCRSSASALLYLSCELATFARDLADLTAQGWRLGQLEAFDFYPHTHHIELLALLTR